MSLEPEYDDEFTNKEKKEILRGIVVRVKKKLPNLPFANVRDFTVRKKKWKQIKVCEGISAAFGFEPVTDNKIKREVTIRVESGKFIVACRDHAEWLNEKQYDICDPKSITKAIIRINVMLRQIARIMRRETEGEIREKKLDIARLEDRVRRHKGSMLAIDQFLLTKTQKEKKSGTI